MTSLFIYLFISFYLPLFRSFLMCINFLMKKIVDQIRFEHATTRDDHWIMTNVSLAENRLKTKHVMSSLN